MNNKNDIYNSWTLGCVDWIRKMFQEAGGRCIVLEISGSRDSLICARLCADAVGKENVYGVYMPYRRQDSDADVERVFSHTGIHRIDLPVGSMALDMAVEFSIGMKEVRISDDARRDMLSRIRTSMLYMVAQSLDGRVCCTCDRSVWLSGNFAVLGECVGDFAPLRELFASELGIVGDILGVPGDISHSVSDERALDFTYEQLEDYISCNSLPAETEDRIKNRIDGSDYKRQLVDVPSYIGG